MQLDTEDTATVEDTTADPDLDASDLTPDEKIDLIEELEAELNQ